MSPEVCSRHVSSPRQWVILGALVLCPPGGLRAPAICWWLANAAHTRRIGGASAGTSAHVGETVETWLLNQDSQAPLLLFGARCRALYWPYLRAGLCLNWVSRPLTPLTPSTHTGLHERCVRAPLPLRNVHAVALAGFHEGGGFS